MKLKWKRLRMRLRRPTGAAKMLPTCSESANKATSLQNAPIQPWIRGWRVDPLPACESAKAAARRKYLKEKVASKVDAPVDSRFLGSDG